MASLPFCVEAYLKNHYISYQVACHIKTQSLEQAASAMAIPEEQVARAILLKDSRGPLMVVLPLTRLLHLTHLREKLNRNLEVLSGPQADRYFPDCEPGSRPPLGEAYGIPTIMDKSLLKQSEVYFEPGNHHVFVKVKREEFLVLASRFSKMDISVPQTFANQAGKVVRQQRNTDLLSSESQRICHKLIELPHFPQKSEQLVRYLGELVTSEMAVEVLQPSADMQQDFNEFISIFNNEICLLPEEITRCVLSTKVLVSLLTSLPMLNDGPLGYTEIVRQSVYTAFLAGMLAYKNNDTTLEPATALLAGGSLYSGILLLGNLFPPEFQLLNRLALAYPASPLAKLEQRLLGMGRAHDVIALGHAQVGAWLLKTWGFPLEVTSVVAKQYHINYKGYAKDYTHIVQIAQNAVAQSGFLGTPRGHDEFNMADKLIFEAAALLQKLLQHSAFLDKIISSIIKDVGQVRMTRQPESSDIYHF